jgi:glutamine amidotransferase
MDVALIDAGGANLGSVRYALERLGVTPRIVRDAAGLAGADRIVLPGVGSAAPAMVALRDRGLDTALRASTVPLLGICLGMQLLFDASDEGDVDCLGLVPGRVRKMRPGVGVRVPHMGWNRLQNLSAHALLEGIQEGDSVYFVHGYCASIGASTLATARHGEAFAAVICHGNRAGMQFHPERSSSIGARLLQNFLGWRP